jgi:hypothetical protein
MDIHITKGFLQKIGWDHTQVIKTLIEEKKMPVWQNLYNYKLNTLKKSRPIFIKINKIIPNKKLLFAFLTRRNQNTFMRSLEIISTL